MVNNFEKIYESIDKEYNQLDESFGKTIKNFVKHPTGKGHGEEILKVLDKFYSKFFFKKSTKDPDMMVKKEKGFQVGLKVDKDDANTKLNIKIVINKKGKITNDEMVVKASWTYDEFVKEMQSKLTSLGAQVTDVDKDSFKTDDDGEESSNKSDEGGKGGSFPGELGDKIIKKLKSAGIGDEKTINNTFTVFDKLYNSSDNAKTLLKFLLEY